jgi:hypothetical protein
MLFTIKSAHTLQNRYPEDKKAQFQPGVEAGVVVNNLKKLRKSG